MSPEFLEALKLVEQYDQSRPAIVKECRLYYNDDGQITMYCETNHPPDTNYIVLTDASVFLNNNTQMLRVVDKQLKIVDVTQIKSRLVKSTTGQPVVKGIAALALAPGEEYQDVEYYDRQTNN